MLHFIKVKGLIKIIRKGTKTKLKYKYFFIYEYIHNCNCLLDLDVLIEICAKWMDGMDGNIINIYHQNIITISSSYDQAKNHSCYYHTKAVRQSSFIFLTCHSLSYLFAGSTYRVLTFHHALASHIFYVDIANNRN